MTDVDHSERPRVLYVAAGYDLPAGVEAYLLHYATELRNQGFDTELIVFKHLPREEHRYLRALRERGIPIRSLYAMCQGRVRRKLALLGLPWMVKTLLCGRVPHLRWFRNWLYKQEAVRELKRLIEAERPDLIHVKARVIGEAWEAFPSENTVYQHALSGTVDPAWNDTELEQFRSFANRCAAILVQGPHIAETFARCFRIERPIDTVFTMAPDEMSAGGGQTMDHGPLTLDLSRGDGGGQTFDHGPLTLDLSRGDGEVRSEGRVVSQPTSDLKRSNVQGQMSNVCRSGAQLRFGILCRFTDQKGIKYILEALQQFRDRHGDVDFTFAGMGPLEGEILAFVAEHGLEHVRVERVESPVQTFENLDVFVHPGLDDAMPVSIVESFMCGVPCIGTRVGGVQDLIRDGVDGLLIEPGSAEEILGAMERFAAMSAEELQGYRQAARERYETMCAPGVVGGQVADVYHRVLEVSHRATELTEGEKCGKKHYHAGKPGNKK